MPPIPRSCARFWAAALGLRAEPTGSDFRLVGEVPEHTLWVNKVPEPRTVKQRVHLDVHVAAVSDLTKLGAVIVDEAQPWTVLADPRVGSCAPSYATPMRCLITESTRWSSTLRIRSLLRPGGPSATTPMFVMIKIGASPGSTGLRDALADGVPIGS